MVPALPLSIYVFEVLACHLPVIDGFDWHLQASVHFTLSSAINKSQWHQKIPDENILWMPGIEPGAVRWEVRMLRLFYVAPFIHPMFVSGKRTCLLFLSFFQFAPPPSTAVTNVSQNNLFVWRSWWTTPTKKQEAELKLNQSHVPLLAESPLTREVDFSCHRVFVFKPVTAAGSAS